METRTTRVLLVDDEPANLSTLEAVLEPLGQRLVRAESGREALRRVLEEDFAVILLDVRLGDMSGLEVMELLRERERSRRTPILLMTAADIGVPELLEGYAHGAVDYLNKPLIPQVLRAKVATFVELQLARDQLRRHEEAQRIAERARWESEQLLRLHALLLQAPVAIAITRGPEFIFEFANSFYEKTVGRPVAPGQPIREVLPELNAQPELMAILRRVLETGDSFRATEFPVLLWRGEQGAPEEAFFDVLYQAARDPSGQVTGVLTFSVEVTEHVRAKRREAQLTQALRARTEELQGSEERLRLALESTALGTWDYNPLTQVLNWDERCKDLIGVSRGTPAARGLIFTRMHPEDRERVQAEMQRAMDPAGRGEYDTEYRHAEPDGGGERWLRATGRVHFEQDRAVRFIGTVQDISERKRAEGERGLLLDEARQRAEENTRLYELTRTQRRNLFAALMQLPEPLVVLRGPDFLVEMANLVLRRALGERLLEGLPVRQAMRELDGQGLFESLTHAYHQGEPVLRKEVVLRWQPPGIPPREGVFNLAFQPLRDADGRVEGLIAVAFEVTEQVHSRREVEGLAEQLRQSEQQLRSFATELETRVRERTAQLQLVNHELESFSYSVSHDLRAPLRHIIGFAQLLERRAGASLDEVARGHLKTITTAARDGGTLVDELLEFSRMGRAELRQTQVDLAQLVREVRRGLEPDMKGRELEWRVAPLPTVRADPALLRQVLRNLLGNALKYTRPRAHAVIEVGTREERGEVEVWVRDNGVGFDMLYANKLFGVFQRLHTVEQFEGTGIGLANVRRIISRHGGRTWAEGVVDQGATFHFTLPGPSLPDKDGLPRE